MFRLVRYRIKQILRLPDNGVRVMVEGLRRGRLAALTATETTLIAQVELLPQPAAARTNSPRTEAMIRQIYALVERYTELSDRVTPASDRA